MALHRFRTGLNLPISGVPDQTIDDAAAPSSVAVVALDYPGMRPTMHVDVGDGVRTGQLLFEDKKTPGVRYTAPGSGTVTEVNRGAKRRLLSVVIRLDGSSDQVTFAQHSNQHPSALSRDDVRDLLLESGLWTALRARPYEKVANPEQTPKSIFVTAIDSSPLAPNLSKVAAGRSSDLERGMAVLLKLTEGTVFFCQGPNDSFEVPDHDRVSVERFAGPHPAGTVGLHIHTLDPVDRNKLVWHLGLQDLLAIGKLFSDGILDLQRVVALGGPCMRNPRLVRTRLGVSLTDLLRGEIEMPKKEGALAQYIDDGSSIREVGDEPHVRWVSGSVLSGRHAAAELAYLGRYHQAVAALEEHTEREFLGWMAPGTDKFSLTNLFVSKLMMGKRFDFNTSTHGSPRAIVPIGLYEKVTPFDLEPTFLLKALVMGDVERAEEFGALELAEEDVALCTFVDPGKTNFGSHLRETLTILEKEG